LPNAAKLFFLKVYTYPKNDDTRAVENVSMNSNGIRAIGLQIVFFLAAVLLLCLLSVLPAPAGETRGAAENILTHEERIWLTNHPVIRLAPERSYAPFIFQDENGKLKGISVDYTALLEKKLGIKFHTMESNNLAAILDAVHHEEIDMVTSLMKTPQRSEFLFFTTPYITVPVVIIVRREFKGGSTLDSMGSLKIAVGKGYAVESFLQEKHSGLSLVPVEDDMACLTKVSFGDIDAAVVDLASASYIIDRLKITNLHVAGTADFSYQLSFASRKDWPELNRILEKGIARISPNEHAEIYNKWVHLSQHTFFTARVIWTALAVILAIILIGVAGAILWNRSLKIKIHQKTEELREELAERRRMEASLRTSEEKFRSLLKLGPVPMGLMDGEGGISFLNDKHIQLFGYTTDDIPTVTEWWQLAFPDETYRAQAIERWRMAVEKATQESTLIDPAEYNLTCKDGTVRMVEISGLILGNDVLACFFDLTEHKQAEEEKMELQAQLLQSQKMESVGRLAGGVAHDFNNMLGIILGFTDLALDQVKPTDPTHAFLEEIFKAANRSADLTRQLLAFARKQTIAPKVLNLNETVEGMLNMLQRLIGEDIYLSWLPAKSLWQVLMDPSQIDQILVNLCVNARDAISDVGKVTIETENSIFDKDYCDTHKGFMPGYYVMMAVSDNGRGMDKDTQASIFEPFFTTKERGKGTGLGLATVYGIVKQNKGFINVYSKIEHGTTFRIYLPRHVGDTTDTQTEDSEKPEACGHETILLVEDEPVILDMTRMMLEHLGYIVMVASTFGEAFRMVKAHSGKIHLLLTDVIMPDMNGRDLAKNLLSFDTHIKSLYMSGYSSNIIAPHGAMDPGVNFIQKPFSLKQLAAKVRDVLDNPRITTQE